ncbi:MAG TPA: sulfurtransferase [Micromonosporaceae bacterium]|nr:sulfurtransferase [Micromonosporaceae bacterium]
MGKLTTTDWLAEHLDDPGLRIVEVDEDTEAYHRGHVPNSVAVNWTTDLQDPIRRDFVSPDAFAALQDRLAITNTTAVVLYGGNNNWFAAYAYWYYRVYGHADVRLVDGGRKAWELEGRKLVTEVPVISPTSGYRPTPPDLSIRAFRGQVLDHYVGNAAAALVDVRSPEEYRGEKLAPDHLPNEAAQRPGHIPGAANIPWAKAVDPETGRFLPDDQLRALYGGQGITADRDVVAYCRIGERSAHTWFVLHELLGYPNVRNYDGSWTEWGSLVGVPIEK